MKQGQIHSFWIQLIIAVFIILALLYFVYLSRVGAFTILSEKSCEQSIDANIRGHIRGLAIDTDINCPTNTNPIIAKSQEDKKKEVAERMNKCWTKFRAGKEELFAENKIYCSICDVFEFEDKASVAGFSDYLSKTKIENEDITYIDYFSGYNTPQAEKALPKLTLAQLQQTKTDELDTSKRYSIIFVYAKGKDEVAKVVRHITWQTPEGKTGFIAGAGTGVAAGATVGITVFLIGSNPVGWAVGTAVVVGAVVDAGAYFLSSDNHPEWASFIMLKEYNAQSLKDLNCQEIK